MTKRRLLLLLVALFIVVGIKKAKSHRESEWHGLTESQARAKLDAKLPSRVPDDKRSAIADKVMAKMHDKGIISDDPDLPDEPSSAAGAPVDLTDGAGEAADLAHH